MTTTLNSPGRLGNQIIRNLAVSLIAEKNNLLVIYNCNEIIEKLGIYLFSGEKKYESIIELTDENYFTTYNQPYISFNLYPNNNFFQTKEITIFIHNYLQREGIKNNIINKNPFKSRYNNNNDILIHIRLTDAVIWNPGLDYYITTIESLNSKDQIIYVTTDEKNHNYIQEIKYKYPSIILLDYDEVQTIQFSSTCKNIILSHGSFSAIIGYLSFFSDIYYPEYELNKLWYGDMFSIEGWNKILRSCSL